MENAAVMKNEAEDDLKWKTWNIQWLIEIEYSKIMNTYF